MTLQLARVSLAAPARVLIRALIAVEPSLSLGELMAAAEESSTARSFARAIQLFARPLALSLQSSEKRNERNRELCYEAKLNKAVSRCAAASFFFFNFELTRVV